MTFLVAKHFWNWKPYSSHKKQHDFSSEIIPTFQQKLTFGFTFSETANNFGITPFRDAAGRVSMARFKQHRPWHKASLSGEQSHPLLSLTPMLWSPRSVVSLYAISKPTSSKGFVFIFKRAETDHGGRAGRIFPATCHSTSAGTAVREQSSLGPCSFRKKVKDWFPISC